MSVRLEVSARESFNFAANNYKNPFISALTVYECAGKNITVRISAKPEFIFEYKANFTPTANIFTITNISLTANEDCFRKYVQEAKKGVLDVELSYSDELEKVIASTQLTVNIQPYYHWDRETDEASAISFLQPNSAPIAKIIKRAGELANAEGGGMYAYYLPDVAPPIKQAEWIFKAISELVLHYCPLPPSFESAGQKIRIPELVLDRDHMQGNCLDLSILYASCLEAVSIHPLLFSVKGHAFAGFWTKESSKLDDMLIRDKATAAKYIWDPSTETLEPENPIVPIECTLMTDNPDNTPSFKAAITSAVESFNESELQYVIDIKESRKSAYYPMFTLPIGRDDEKSEEAALLDSGDEAIRSEVATAPAEKLTKLERLCRQAMEFDFGSSLISMNASETAVGFPIDAAKLFGGEYSIEAIRTLLFESFEDRKGVQGFLLDMMKREREAQRDSGSTVVYLAVGKLLWTSNSGRNVESPLYLFPLNIYRNQRGETVFGVKTDECVFNPALKELLNKEYGMDLSSLSDKPDEKYPEQIKQLRAIIDGNGRSIEENTAVIGVFKMPNAAIYRALHSEKLASHPIVKGILDGSMTWDNEIVTDEKEESNIYPFPTDGSQRKVIHSLPHKRAQVVFGPAGNGKSQTIANIIALKMSQGRPVLFVAEKLAAQQVIYDKLKELGLDTFTLMLSADKRSSSEATRQIESALKQIGRHRNASAVTTAISKYGKLVDELKAYYERIRASDEEGESLLGLLLEAESYRNVKDIFDGKLLPMHMKNPNAGDLMQSMADFLSEENPEPIADVLRFKGLEESLEKRMEIAELIDRARVNKADIEDSTHDFAYALGLPEIASDAELCLEYIAILANCPIVGKNIPKADPRKIEELNYLSDKLTSISPESIEYQRVYTRFTELLTELDEASDIRDELPYDGGYRVSGAIRPEERASTMKIMAYKKYEKELMKDKRIRSNEHRYALFTASRLIARREADELLTAARKLKTASSTYTKTRDEALRASTRTNSGYSPEECFAMWKTANLKDVDYSKYAKAVKRFREAGFAGLLTTASGKIANGTATAEDILPSYEKARCTAKINELLSKLPDSVFVDGLNDSSRLNRIQKAENEARKQYRAKLLNDTVGKMPNIGVGVKDDPELGAIQRLIRRSGGTLRELFTLGGSALIRICPCMIMGPETAAELIPEDFPSFDTVIFDEGSQLPTYKALPSVAKAEKCLVIGDEKQLTPTSFFVRSIEDENGIATTREAILEDAIVCSMPQLMLNYHYRSKYESLVAFSNDRYYGGEIVTFPDCITDRVGLDYIFVEDGVYKCGTSRNNYPEAKRVVELCCEIYSDLPKDTEKTLGIITFNIEQKKLIDSVIASYAAEKPELCEQLSNLVDVVNLEACQGKEWDVTVISPAYGPDEEGKLPTSFGPMNREEGRNRLNVIITRAREHMYVVSSMKADMFAENAKNGTADLRDFIAFASGEAKLDTKNTAASSYSSDIVEDICEALSENGRTTHTDIGCSDCKVDIGVLDSEGERYALGIILDDFDGFFDVIDKESLIPNMLSAKGWKLYRLHTVNWYKDKDRELSNILKLLD